jgi:hypothetical protein
MLRKIGFALVAAAALGTAALAPTSASAWGHGHGFHGGRHGGWGHRDFGRGGWGHRDFGGGPGWCYYHPYRCR